MLFHESEIIAIAKIGFDLIEGPSIKWFRQFRTLNFNLDVENFLMNFYLSFKGGDETLQPLAIFYRSFYIVAFPQGLELCCVFLNPENFDPQLERLAQIAEEFRTQIDNVNETDEKGQGTGSPSMTPSQNYSEIKRIVINLLNKQEYSTPELRKYFKLQNSEIWKIMGELEDAHKIIRTQKIGRVQYWTAAA